MIAAVPRRHIVQGTSYNIVDTCGAILARVTPLAEAGAAFASAVARAVHKLGAPRTHQRGGHLNKACVLDVAIARVGGATTPHATPLATRGSTGEEEGVRGELATVLEVAVTSYNHKK